MSKDFKFTIPLDSRYVIRSEQDEATGNERQWLVLKGWASDSSVDKLRGKMSERCIVGMVNCVNDGSPSPVFRNHEAAKNPTRLPVGIDVDHSGHWTDQIGRATVARAIYDMTPEMQSQGITPPVMYVEFEVDLRKSHGRDLQVSLDDGDKLGLSIFGKVKRAFTDKAGIEHFDEIDLQRIAITSRPVNNVTWIQEIRRSMPEDELTQNTKQEATEVEESNDTVATDTQDAAPVAEESTEADTTEETQAEGNSSVEPSVEAAEVSVTQTPDGELAPDAIADLVAMGAIDTNPPAQEIATPAENVVESVVAAPVAESAQASTDTSAETAPAEESAVVSRAEDSTEWLTRSVADEGYVARAVYDAFEQDARTAIGSAAEALTRADEVIGNLKETITTQADVIRSLVSRLDTVEHALNQGMGRRGSVARSLAEEQTEETLITNQVDKEQRDRVMRELVLRGQGHMATAMLMEQAGLLKLPAGHINDPLLPGQARQPHSEPEQGLMPTPPAS